MAVAQQRGQKGPGERATAHRRRRAINTSTVSAPELRPGGLAINDVLHRASGHDLIESRGQADFLLP
jgi:hypothetical protein